MATQESIRIAKLIRDGNMEKATEALQACNDKYYNEGASNLTDEEFDKLLAAFTGRFGTPLKTAPRLHSTAGKTAQKAEKSVKTSTTGVRTDRQAVVPHDWPLLSGWLDKAASMTEYLQWENARGDGAKAASPKWDGLSVVITYNQFGVVQKALTRGENGLGVDITKAFAGESHFNNHDFGVEHFGIKYEVVMSWAALEQMNSDIGGEYKNPRNTVPGIVGADDPSSRRQYITLVPLDITWDDCEDSREVRIDFMRDLFTPVEVDNTVYPPLFTGNGDNETPFFFWLSTSGVFDDFTNGVYDYVAAMRAGVDGVENFMIDGVVFEYIDTTDIERLGGVSNDCPDYAIALKFPSLTGRTVVESIDFDVGLTGRRTPVVNYKPFTLDGRTFTRSSISNMLRFDALKLCVGTPIIVEIRGDVISWLTRDGDDPEGATPIAEPDNLEFTYNKLGQRVFAFAEAPLAGRCERMLTKMGIKGIKIETFNKLVDEGLITKLGDFFRLSKDEVAAIPGLGESSAQFICNSAASKLKTGLWDWEIIASVGITNIGRTLSKEVLKVVSLTDLLGDSSGVVSAQTVNAVKQAIGDERGTMVINGVQKHHAEILDLVSLGEPRSTIGAQAAVSSDTPKYKVVVTGELDGWPEREQFKDYIESLGHKMVGSISGKTDLLITNDPNSGTVKNKRARELGVRIVTEAEAIEIMGLTSPAPKGSPVDTPTTEEVDLDDL